MVDFSNTASVERIIKGCIKGEKKYQKILYQSFYGKMLAVCMRYATDRNEAQDILHDGYIKVFSKLSGYEYKGSFEGWIRRIIVNNAIDFIRNKKDFIVNINEDTNIENIDDDSVDIEENKISQMKAEIIIELIQKLSPAYRTVFNMYVIEEYSHKEIAEELNISIGTSKSNLAKAKIKLQKLFEEYNFEKRN